MHCMRQSPALVLPVGGRPGGTGMPSRRGGARRSQPAIYRRRLTAQTPLRGHRVVAARLSKIP
ncbi:hypothetical protein CIB50_0001118 [Kocuria varians]|uniref:Uncharacterized protein n=2 Tax=Kocuria varians TaxID=1272 RepID=A0A7D7PRR0_KOCVA|nr:hypothetical protein CIB50_0001118 [Kocuria varians]